MAHMGIMVMVVMAIPDIMVMAIMATPGVMVMVTPGAPDIMGIAVMVAIVITQRSITEVIVIATLPLGIINNTLDHI